MIVKDIQRNIVESHDFKSEIATIDSGEMRYISSLLRNNYSNTVLATARETIANAVDANKGSSRLVEITAPTRLSPTFVVRDFGAGLSESDLFGLYTKYGRSTKRSDNASIGGFGIGRFAPLSYTDSFTVTSRHDGTEIVVSVYVDESGDTRFTKLSETATSEPSGLEVSVAVKSEDVFAFEDEIKKVIRFSDQQFVCHYFSRQIPEWAMKNADWGVVKNSRANGPIIVMGGISYPLNLDSLSNHTFANSKTYKAFKSSYASCSFVFFFPVGSVALHHSRENLEYNTQAKNFIARAIANLEAEIKTQIQKEIDLISDSEKFFIKLCSFSSSFNVASICSDLDFLFTDANKNVIKINNDHIVPLAIYIKSRQSGNLMRLSKTTKRVENDISAKLFYSSRDYHIVINDDVKDVQGRVNGLMTAKKIDKPIYVISLADAESKLLYKHNSCERIHLASKLVSVPIKSNDYGTVRKIFCASKSIYAPYDLKEKVPMPTGPFYYVELKSNPTAFKSPDIVFGDFVNFSQNDLRSVWKIARHFGINCDSVYGVFVKSDLPAHAINLHDTLMPKFKAAIVQFKSILNFKEKKEVRRRALPIVNDLHSLRKQLPDKHPISVYFDSWNVTDDVQSHGFSMDQQKEFDILMNLPHREQSNIFAALDQKIVEEINKEALTIRESYPMMFALIEGHYGSFVRIQNSKLILDYINLVDNRKP